MDTNNTKQEQHNTKDNKMIFGILSYLGPLVIIPLLVSKKDPFVKFHIKQGLVLLCIEIILWVLSGGGMMWSFWPLYRIIHFALLIFSIIGIINVIQKKEKELPLIGGLARYFPV